MFTLVAQHARWMEDDESCNPQSSKIPMFLLGGVWNVVGPLYCNCKTGGRGRRRLDGLRVLKVLDLSGCDKEFQTEMYEQHQYCPEAVPQELLSARNA